MGETEAEPLGSWVCGGVSLRLEMEAWSMGSLLEQKFPHQRGSRQVRSQNLKRIRMKRRSKMGTEVNCVESSAHERGLPPF